MIKVAIALSGPNELNGPNVWTTRIVPMLRDQGVDPAILYLERYEGREECRYVESLRRQGIRILKISLSPHIEDNIRNIALLLFEEGVNAVLPNYSVAAFYAAGILRRYGVASVGIIHSDDPFYLDIENFFVLGEECWRVTEVVAVSSYLAERLNRANLSNLPQVRYIPYGVPKLMSIPQKDSKILKIIYCGRFVDYQKRIIRTIEISQKILNEFESVSFVFIGDGPELPVVEKFAKQNCPRVEILRAASPDVTVSALASGDLFILFSDFEGMSIAMVEAMAAGLVPLVSNIKSGVAEVIDNGMNGFVVDPENTGEILDIVRQLIRDPCRLPIMSASCRDLVATRGLYLEQTVGHWASVIGSAVARERLVTSDLKLISSTIASTIEVALSQLPPPSNTKNGIAWEDRRNLVYSARKASGSGMNIYVWGASSGGGKVFESLYRERVPIEAFVDSDPHKWGQELFGRKILAPKDLMKKRSMGERIFVIVATSFKEGVSSELEKNNFKESTEYFEAW